jgi:hypothetical protein
LILIISLKKSDCRKTKSYPYSAGKNSRKKKQSKESSMTTKQEIKKLLRERALSIVDERILPETLDNIAEWTGELMGKLTTLDPNNQKQIDEAFSLLHEGLVKETIEQLVEPLSERRKKLFAEK